MRCKLTNVDVYEMRELPGRGGGRATVAKLCAGKSFRTCGHTTALGMKNSRIKCGIFLCVFLKMRELPRDVFNSEVAALHLGSYLQRHKMTWME